MALGLVVFPVWAALASSCCLFFLSSLRDTSLPTCLPSQVGSVSPQCPHTECVSLSSPGNSEGILRLGLLESKVLSKMVLGIASLKHQKVPHYVVLARKGCRNRCCCRQQSSAPGKVCEWCSICTLQS